MTHRLCSTDRVNREGFLTDVRDMLAPTLSEGAVVVAGTLACRKHPDVGRALRAAGVRLILLPSHAPDPDSIEPKFAKLEHLLREAQG